MLLAENIHLYLGESPYFSRLILIRWLCLCKFHWCIKIITGWEQHHWSPGEDSVCALRTRYYSDVWTCKDLLLESYIQYHHKAGWLDKWNMVPLQKSLLENCQSRLDRRDELKSLRTSCEKAQEKLRDKERELAAAQAENQTLRLQVILYTHVFVCTLTHSHTASCIHNFQNITMVLWWTQWDSGHTEGALKSCPTTKLSVGAL